MIKEGRKVHRVGLGKSVDKNPSHTVDLEKTKLYPIIPNHTDQQQQQN